MPKKFSGFPNQGLRPEAPKHVQAADEKTLVLRYSPTVGYIDMNEANGKQIDAIETLTVLLNICLQFLGQVAGQRSMLVGQKGSGGEEKKDDTSSE